MTVKLAIAGCCGRMGQRIAALALANTPPLTVAAAIEAKGHPAIGKPLELAGSSGAMPVVTDDVTRALQDSDVLIEFTTPEATMEHVRIAKELRKPMVIGTTGLDAERMRVIKEAAAQTPILLSPNMSVGVNFLFELVRLAAERLPDYKVAIEETHHAGKKDAPSGTAKRLQEVLAQIKREDIPCTSTRIGEVVGEHTVTFTGKSEQLTLTHEAFSRDVFALGALRAAQFLSHVTRPGLYDMSDALRELRS